MYKKTIVISGGAGFLGSHLSEKFLNEGFLVIAVDNLSTGSLQNIAHLSNDSSFLFINHDICKPLPDEITNHSGINVVANLASPASPPHYQRLALETLAVGSEGTKTMINLAFKNNARFFHASTSEVYGDPEVHPQPEAYKGAVNCYGPRSMYDESKRFSESLIYAHRKINGLNSTIARFFNTYGPRMDANDGRVVSNFIVQALAKKPITIYGDGRQTRSFCYVDDLIEAIYLLICSKQEGPINLGNPTEFTIKELADIVLFLTNSSSKIKYLPLPGDDPLQRKPDISLAQETLGWNPTIELKDGLVKTIQYFSNLKNRLIVKK